MLEEFNMSVLKSSQTMRWERRETDEQELSAKRIKECIESCLQNYCGSTEVDLRCAMGKTSSSLGRASDTDMKNVKSVLRYFRGIPGIMPPVRRTTLNLEAVKRAPVDAVLTNRDSDWTDDF